MSPEDGEMRCDICTALIKQVLASGQMGDEADRKERRKVTERM